MAEYLVGIGADIEKATVRGETPICVAAHCGHLEIVKFLVSVGADKDKPKANGDTPVIVAARNKHRAVVAFLLQQAASKAQPAEVEFLSVASSHKTLSGVCARGVKDLLLPFVCGFIPSPSSRTHTRTRAHPHTHTPHFHGYHLMYSRHKTVSKPASQICG